jgi:Mg2+/Co2+ transporter CorC
MKRYDTSGWDRSEMVERKEGNWVAYEDAQKEIDNLKDVIREAFSNGTFDTITVNMIEDVIDSWEEE